MEDTEARLHYLLDSVGASYLLESYCALCCKSVMINSFFDILTKKD